MPLGSFSLFPLKLGGRVPAQRIYRAMLDREGQGGAADSDQGLEALWRRSRAKGLSAIGAAYRRAVNQHFPDLASDALDAYGRALGIERRPISARSALGPYRNATAQQVQFRDEIVQAWTERLSAIHQDLETSLQRLDARFSLLTPTLSISAWQGRMHRPHDNGGDDAFGLSEGIAAAPNYSSDFVIRVLFDLGYSGAPNPADQVLEQRAIETLRQVLPAWCTWAITHSTDGFELDSDLLDLASLDT